MKSISLSIILFLFLSCNSIFAQDTLKTMPKGWTTELNINPLQGQISLNNAINQIKVRYFSSEQTALRLAFSFNSSTASDGSKSTYGTNPVNNTEDKKTNSFSLNLGFEHHLKGTRRLSPYIGAEVSFGIKSSEESFESIQSTEKIKGAWITMQTYPYYNSNGTINNYYTTTVPSERGYTSLGVNLLTGFDYYIAKHFFVGYEILFGYNHIKYDDIEYTITAKPGQTIGNTTTNPTESSSESNIGAKIINGIRLGYTF